MTSPTDDDLCQKKDDDIPVIEPSRFEDKIDDTNLKPCMKNLIANLKNQSKGLSWVINHFAGNNSNYNWKVEHGSLSGDATAVTPNNSYNSASSTVTSILALINLEMLLIFQLSKQCFMSQFMLILYLILGKTPWPPQVRMQI